MREIASKRPQKTRFQKKVFKKKPKKQKKMKIFFFMIFFFVLLKIFPEIVAENQIKFKSDFFIRKFSNNFIVFELLVVIY